MYIYGMSLFFYSLLYRGYFLRLDKTPPDTEDIIQWLLMTSKLTFMSKLSRVFLKFIPKLDIVFGSPFYLSVLDSN